MEKDLRDLHQAQKDARDAQAHQEVQKRDHFEMVQGYAETVADHQIRSMYERQANKPVTAMENRDAFKLHRNKYKSELVYQDKRIVEYKRSIEDLKLTRGTTTTTTTAGNVSEWLTEQVDETIYTIVERNLQIASMFQHITIARGRSDVKVFQETGTGFDDQANFWDYDSIGRLTQGTAITTKINPTSANKIVSTIKYGGLQEITGEVDEDAISAAIARLSTTLPRAAARTWDLALLNGDANLGTGLIEANNLYTTSADVATLSILSQIRGLRSLGLDTFIDNGGGVFTVDNLRKVYRIMDHFAMPSRNKIVTSYSGWVNLLDLDEFKTIDLVGARATLLTGEFGSIDGRGIIISDEFRPTNAAGTFTTPTTGAPATFNIFDSYLVVNPDPFRIYTSREVKMEADRDITSDVNTFVLTSRATFQKVFPDQTSEPIGYLANVSQ